MFMMMLMMMHAQCLPRVEVGGVKQEDDNKAGNDGAQNDDEDGKKRSSVIEVGQTVAG